MVRDLTVNQTYIGNDYVGSSPTWGAVVINSRVAQRQSNCLISNRSGFQNSPRLL